MTSRIPPTQSELENEGLPDLETYEGKDVTGDTQDGVMAPRDTPRAVDDYGTTAEEEAAGEPLDLRVTREQPEVDEYADQPADESANTDQPYPAAADLRTGRLVEPDEGARPDEEPDAVATDVGTDHGGFSAEELAMHTEPGG